MGPREPLRAITNKPATCAAPNKLSVGTLSSSERENRSDFFGNKAERPKECEAQSRDSYGRHHYHHHHSSQRDQRVDQMPEKACVLERCYAANDSADGENVDHGSTSPTIDRETNNNAESSSSRELEANVVVLPGASPAEDRDVLDRPANQGSPDVRLLKARALSLQQLHESGIQRLRSLNSFAPSNELLECVSLYTAAAAAAATATDDHPPSYLGFCCSALTKASEIGLRLERELNSTIKALTSAPALEVNITHDPFEPSESCADILQQASLAQQHLEGLSGSCSYSLPQQPPSDANNGGLDQIINHAMDDEVIARLSPASLLSEPCDQIFYSQSYPGSPKGRSYGVVGASHHAISIQLSREIDMVRERLHREGEMLFKISQDLNPQPSRQHSVIREFEDISGLPRRQHLGHDKKTIDFLDLQAQVQEQTIDVLKQLSQELSKLRSDRASFKIDSEEMNALQAELQQEKEQAEAHVSLVQDLDASAQAMRDEIDERDALISALMSEKQTLLEDNQRLERTATEASAKVDEFRSLLFESTMLQSELESDISKRDLEIQHLIQKKEEMRSALAMVDDELHSVMVEGRRAHQQPLSSASASSHMLSAPSNRADAMSQTESADLESEPITHSCYHDQQKIQAREGDVGPDDTQTEDARREILAMADEDIAVLQIRLEKQSVRDGGSLPGSLSPSVESQTEEDEQNSQLVQPASNRGDTQAAQKMHQHICSLKSHSSSLEAKNKGLRQQLTEALKAAGRQRAMVEKAKRQVTEQFEKRILDLEQQKQQQQQQQPIVQKASTSSQTEWIELESRKFHDASTETTTVTPVSTIDEEEYSLIMNQRDFLSKQLEKAQAEFYALQRDHSSSMDSLNAVKGSLALAMERSEAYESTIMEMRSKELDHERAKQSLRGDLQKAMDRNAKLSITVSKMRSPEQVMMMEEEITALKRSMRSFHRPESDSNSLIWESSTEEDDLSELDPVKDSGFDGVRMFHNPVSSMPVPRQMQDKFFQNLEIYRGGYVLSSDNALAMHCFLHSLNFEAASLWCKISSMVICCWTLYSALQSCKSLAAVSLGDQDSSSDCSLYRSSSRFDTMLSPCASQRSSRRTHSSKSSTIEAKYRIMAGRMEAIETEESEIVNMYGHFTFQGIRRSYQYRDKVSKYEAAAAGKGMRDDSVKSLSSENSNRKLRPVRPLRTVRRIIEVLVQLNEELRKSQRREGDFRSKLYSSPLSFTERLTNSLHEKSWRGIKPPETDTSKRNRAQGVKQRAIERQWR